MDGEVRQGSFFSSTAEAIQLAIRLTKKTFRPLKMDAAYLFAHTPDNMWPVIIKGGELYVKQRCVEKLVILGLASKVMHKNPDGKFVPDYNTPAMVDSEKNEDKPTLIHAGWQYWIDNLHSCGVEKADIVISSLADPIYTARAYNTHTEAVAFVKMAKERSWRYLIIVSPIWHIMRATAEVVTAALNYYPEAIIHVEPGDVSSEDWIGKSTIQTQNDIKPQTRMDSIANEIVKMDVYYRKGDHDLRSAKEILAYFNERDHELEAQSERIFFN